jgi:hypothetical protein
MKEQIKNLKESLPEMIKGIVEEVRKNPYSTKVNGKILVANTAPKGYKHKD